MSCLAVAGTLSRASAQSATIFSDGFESGDFSAWTSVVARSGGSAAVQSVDVKTGAYAASLSSGTAAGSVAYLRNTFPAGHADLTVSGDFKITAEGAANSNVPIFRLFDSAGTRLVSFYRQNQDWDKLWLQHSGTYNSTTGTLPLNSWARVELHVIAGGAGASTVEARLNGAPIYATQTASLPSGGVATVQIGNNTSSQAFGLVADDLSVSTGSSTSDSPPDTTIDSGPSETVASSAASFTFSSSETSSTFECSLDQALFTSCSSPHEYKFLSTGNHVFGVRATDAAGNVDATPASRSWTVSSTGLKLLIADLRNRRLVITDLDGRLVWKFDNPTGRDHPDSGPLGVRWLPGNQILATFGTGEVGVIDVASKTWVWKTSGYNADWFQSPYDAEILPDGNLAVAMRYNEGGRIVVYDRSTGKVVWRHLLSNAHSVKFRTAEQSYNSPYPTLLVGGWGSIREVAYRPNGGQNVTWSVKTEFTHDAIVVENDLVLTTEGYYIQKIDRQGGQIWRHSTPQENRRIVVNPAGGYIYTVGEGDRIEFRDIGGNLVRQWSALSDGSSLDYPYGLQLIDFTG
ncbi:MAG: PQQ-binding-like beta-propeller repeat protein [Actinomycetota bacterium]